MHRVSIRHILTAMTASLVLAAVLAGASGSAVASPGHDGDRSGLDRDNVLEIIARHPPGGKSDDHYEFVLSDKEIPAGWTTIRQVNASHTVHFVYMIKVPEAQADMTREEYLEGTPKAFQDAWDPYFAGDDDVNAFFDNLVSALPEWWADTVPSGGPGFLSGGRTGTTTMNLAPGTYFVECYVLDGDGVFHNTHGMLEKLVVTDQANEAREPEADMQVRVSAAGGIAFDTENIQPGAKTIEVIFEDNLAYGHGLGHDVHLVRLDDGTTVEDVNVWMNYLDVGADGLYADRGALISGGDKPEPETFLGGVQDVFAAEYPQSAHFHVDLKPGRYALVAEVPNPMQPDPDNPEMSMLKTFSVTPYASLTGGWFDPETAGQGWSFIAAPWGLYGFYFGYDSTGDPLWLMTEEVQPEIEVGESVTYGLLNGTGGTFSNPVAPGDLDYWGEVTLTFESCEEATAEISGLDGTDTHELVKISQTAGLPDCRL